METHVSQRGTAPSCIPIVSVSLPLFPVDVTVSTQKRQHSRLSFEEMGNELLDAMQGTLLCLDAHHIIVDVSKTVKQYFGFEQVRALVRSPHVRTVRFSALLGRNHRPVGAATGRRQ